MFQCTPVREKCFSCIRWVYFSCLLLVKQDLNQSADAPRIAQKRDLYKKNSWFMQSKAFARSQKIPQTCIFWLIELNMLRVSLKAAFSLDIPVLHLTALWPVNFWKLQQKSFLCLVKYDRWTTSLHENNICIVRPLTVHSEQSYTTPAKY